MRNTNRHDLSAINFIQDIPKFLFDNKGSLIALIPKDKDFDKVDFLEHIANKLNFPHYFGGNWDSLSDCLRDFKWTDKKRIIIVHEGIPKLADQSALKTYVKVLIDCVKDWGLGDDHELIVVFPEKSRKKLEKLVFSDLK